MQVRTDSCDIAAEVAAVVPNNQAQEVFSQGLRTRLQACSSFNPLVVDLHFHS